MELYSMIWLVALIVFISVEIATLGLASIWFAGGSLVAFIASFFGANLIVQVILFLVVSIVLLVLTRPIAAKYFNKNRAKTNVDAIVGRNAVVIKDIDNLKGEGEINLAGQIWTARAIDDKVIEENTQVKIVSIEGVKAMVKPVAK